MLVDQEARLSDLHGQIQNEGGLAQAWAARHDVQVTGVKPGAAFVQLRKAAGDTGDCLPTLRGCRQERERSVDGVPQGYDGTASRHARNIEAGLLRLVDELLDVLTF